MSNEIVAFPQHDINPKLKDKDWCLQAGKAIWGNWSKNMPNGSIFYAKRQRYNEIREYALNRQSNAKYLRLQTGEETPDTAFLNIDQSTDAIVKTHRQKILGRLKKIAFNITAQAIDPLAKNKMDDFFAEKKVKIMMRQAMEQQDPQLAQHPMLAKEQGDAEDIEELEMQMQFSPQFIRSKECEQAIAMIFYENEFGKLADLVDEDLVDFGVAVLREGIDENNRVYIEYHWPGDFICSFSDTGNFDKMTHAGVLKRVPMSQLAKYFAKDELDKIARACAGKDGNPQQIPSDTNMVKGFDSFKATVFEFEIMSYDMLASEQRINKLGNVKYNRIDPDKIKKDSEDGKKKYDSKTIETIYKGCWVVGTDLIYGYGKATNTKRSVHKEKMGKTALSFQVIAASYDRMHAKGITEDLIPIADEIQMVNLKLRNANNRMIPNGISVDFGALENVALGGSGTKGLTPSENLDMLFQTGVLGVRSDMISQDGKNQRKAVEPLIFDYLNWFTAAATYKQSLIANMYEVSGLNQTDSATVSPKLLVGVVNAQNAGTNNALYFLENARRKLVERTARSVYQRLQTALQMGPYEGYVQALGKLTMEFIKFEADNLPHDIDIIIEDKPSDEQKQLVIQSVQKEIEKGILDSSDVIAILNNYNLKDAQMMVAYKAKKAKERMQQEAMQQQQMNGQIQQQSAQMTAQMAAEALQLEYQLKMQLEDKKGEWQYKIAELNAGVKNYGTEIGAQSKMAQTAMVEQNKMNLAQPGAEGAAQYFPPQQGMPQEEQAEIVEEEPQQEMMGM